MELTSRLRQEESREKFIEGAWIGFQMGAAGDDNFHQYLERLGILGEIGGTGAGAAPPPRSLTKEQAIAKAEEILTMARKKKAE